MHANESDDVNEYLLSGIILVGEDFTPASGHVLVRDSIIADVVEGDVDVDSLASGIVMPGMVNSHTHIGDSIARGVFFSSLEELVGPDGIKHRILESASGKELVSGMKSTIQEMMNTGTTCFSDFREGGIEGVKLLRTAMQGVNIKTRILGRPLKSPDELDEVLQLSDGIGLSSTGDYETSFTSEVARRTREAGGMFAIHAGERLVDDIESALSLDADFLVHLTQASDREIRMIADAGVPVVVCVRSNLATGVGEVGKKPPVREMLDAGILLAAGTDNAMLNSADMFSEASSLMGGYMDDAVDVLRMCTLNGARVLGLGGCGIIETGMQADLVVLDSKLDDTGTDGLSALLRRLACCTQPDDIVLTVCGGSISFKKEIVWSG